MSYSDGIKELSDIWEQAVGAALRGLLEYKHLYQSIEVNVGVYESFQAANKGPKEAAVAALDRGKALKNGPWRIFPGPSGQYNFSTLIPPSIGGSSPRRDLEVRAPVLKLYCAAKSCRRIEPFHAAACTDILPEEEARSGRQIIVLRYVCQSCRGEPTVFLVRRDGLKLTLTGRSPIEHIDVPKVIPRPIERFFSGAVVAHQSGQTLAGNFLLRTMVEQWVRSFPATAQMRADEALNWYYYNLPDDFRQRFPSLREVYEMLSSVIHAAGGDAEIFAAQRAAIIKHFDAWRLYELDHATFGESPSERSD